jgi:hypothetical protein
MWLLRRHGGAVAVLPSGGGAAARATRAAAATVARSIRSLVARSGGAVGEFGEPESRVGRCAWRRQAVAAGRPASAGVAPCCSVRQAGDSWSSSDGAAVAKVDRLWPLLCTGLRCHGESFALLGTMMAMSLDVVFFLGSVNRSDLFPLCSLPSLVKTWTFWLGDGGTSGVAFLLGGVVLEARVRSVYYSF